MSVPIKKFSLNNLEKLYSRYNHRRYVHPDPLEFLYKYNDPADREIVALVASSLAYGRVAQILKSVEIVLKTMGSPLNYVKSRRPALIHRDFSGFKHRFTTGTDIALLLIGIKQVIRDYGNLENSYLASDTSTVASRPERTIARLTAFTDLLNKPIHGGSSYLLPSPTKGSACKRMNLMLRWLVRQDDVDPGGWSRCSASELIIPVDTHILNISRSLGLTSRKAGSMKTALEITGAFAKISPSDPTRYDFALTRPGIGGH